VGYGGKLDLKLRALELRKRGMSYNEIKLKVPVSKDTLSRWCRDVILTPEQRGVLLKKKIEGANKGRLLGAKKLQQRRINQINELFEKGKNEIGGLSVRDRFIAGAALYLGEGYRTDRAVGFANSDPTVIKFMMDWFRKFADVPEERFTGQIWIYKGRDRIKAERFWSNLTGIPITRFSKTYIAENKDNSRKIRKNVHEFGVFSIRISMAGVQRRILGWTAGILCNGTV
jgi:hypothetical protein